MVSEISSHSQDQVIKVFYHHPFKFFLQVMGTAIASVPFFLVASFFSGIVTTNAMIDIYSGIILVFGLIIFYEAFVFFKDKLIISNQRIIHIDWQSLFKRTETSIALKDVLDINTEDDGLLDLIPLLRYGEITIETAGDGPGIVFKNATDPEGIKHFIYHLQLKPSKIESGDTVTNQGFIYDRTHSEQDQTTHSSG